MANGKLTLNAKISGNQPLSGSLNQGGNLVGNSQIPTKITKNYNPGETETQDVRIENDTIYVDVNQEQIASVDYVNNHHDATKQDKLTAGENITIVGNVISASDGGASSWDDLTDKPFNSIDDNTLIVRDGVLAAAPVDVPTTLAELTDDATHRTVTDIEKTTWNAKSDFSGNYDDLENKPTIPAAVTEATVSGWGFTKNTGTYSKPSDGIPKADLASAVKSSLEKADSALQSVPSGYATETYVDNHHDATKQDKISDLATIRSGAAMGATAIQEESDPTVPSWAKASVKPSYTAAEVGARPSTWVPTLEELGLDTDEAEELQVDTVVTSGSGNLITSGAVYTAIQQGGGTDLPTTSNLLKGDGAGGAAAAVPGTDYAVPSAIPQKKVWYGTCPTTASTANKVVTTGENFGFVAGNVLFVKFTNANTVSSPKLVVDGANQIAIYPTTSYMWQSGYVVGFVYDGTYFRDLIGPYATTTYYGVTKLSSAVNSTSTILAATPSQVKQAYDLAQSKMDQPTGGLVGQVFSKTSTGNQFQDLPQPTTRSQASYWTITFVEGGSILDILFPLGTSQHTATLDYNGVRYNTIQPDSSGNIKFGNDIVFSSGTWTHGDTITLYSYDTSDAQLYDFFFKPGYNTVVEHGGGSPEYIPGAIKAEITSDTTGVQQKVQSDGFAYVDTYSKQQIDQALSSYITDIANLVGGNA